MLDATQGPPDTFWCKAAPVHQVTGPPGDPPAAMHRTRSVCSVGAPMDRRQFLRRAGALTASVGSIALIGAAGWRGARRVAPGQSPRGAGALPAWGASIPLIGAAAGSPRSPASTPKAAA